MLNNVSRNEVLSLAGWAIAFAEMIQTLEYGCDSIGSAAAIEAEDIAWQVFGLGDPDIEEEDFRRPEIVALFATAHERAARMLATAAEAEESCLRALDTEGEPYAYGLVDAAERLRDAARLAREEGDALAAWPAAA